MIAASLIIAITCHEFAHAFAVYKLGDNTAKNNGRLTLNPLKHIDPIGALFMFVFRFGWAKGVPINPMNFGHRKRDTIIVSLAGVTTNFVIAIVAALLMRTSFVYRFNWLPYLLIWSIWYNVMLGVFNLVPLPPLDGSKVVASLMPSKIEYYFYKYERYFYIVLVILIMTDVIDYVMAPAIEFIINILLG